MISRKVRNRLELLNKRKLKNIEDSDSDSITEENRENQPSVHEPALIIQGNRIKHITLEEAVPGQVASSEDGEFLLIKRSLKKTFRASKNIIKSFPAMLKSFQAEDKVSELNALESIHPSKILFLDIETCGLSAEPLFLIGVAYFTGEDFSFLQLFARNYSEERPLLSFFNRLLSQYKAIVTYNGKSFDMPFILSRASVNKTDIPGEVLHVDLLNDVRRKLKHRIPNCKLQTVEKVILGRNRVEDIPGREIPRVYREYIKTRNAYMVKNILEHNLIDILSMIDIVMILTEINQCKED
jgi:uncharacterized protein YprB with RNaseH-like and TPR domain